MAGDTHNEGTLHDRVALVTGGGRGIGRAIALAFAGEGARVAVAARTADEIDAVARECGELGVEAMPVGLDVADPGSCRQAVDRCLKIFGRIDILLNNAGVGHAQRFLSIDGQTWDHVLRVDLSGAFYLTQAVLPGMLEREDGAVIAISSIAGKIGAKYYTAYCAAKHGLIGLMRALAAEYPDKGVTFNSVCPAYADTSMVETAITGLVARTSRSREEALRAFATPQGRLVRPEEIAAVCLLLAGPDGKGITGQAINVDGGQVQS